MKLPPDAPDARRAQRRWRWERGRDGGDDIRYQGVVRRNRPDRWNGRRRTVTGREYRANGITNCVPDSDAHSNTNTYAYGRRQSIGISTACDSDSDAYGRAADRHVLWNAERRRLIRRRRPDDTAKSERKPDRGHPGAERDLHEYDAWRACRMSVVIRRRRHVDELREQRQPHLFEHNTNDIRRVI